MFPVGKTKIRILTIGNLNKQKGKGLRNLGIERLKSVGYTVNSHNWSFLSWFFHHEEHEEHKEIIKALLLIFVRLRVLRGLIFS